MNLELRTKVLEHSLVIEDLLSGCLEILFRFPVQKEQSKTLGTSGSSLSLKTKADLLNDLGRFTKDEYSNLIMFMEIRNQLIHNLGIDTITKAAEKSNKLNKLMELIPSGKNPYSNTDLTVAENKEEVLEYALRYLVLKIVTSIRILNDTIIAEINEARDFRRKSFREEAIRDVVAAMAKAVNDTSEQIDEAVIKQVGAAHTGTGFVNKIFWPNFRIRLEEIYPEIGKAIDEGMKKENDLKDK